jgi:DNA-binding transcriptional LysR family regulator
MQVDQFPLSSNQCEILMAFETAGSLASLADHFKKDISVMSRQLQTIAQTLPVLQKQRGKWVLTALGKQVCTWSREYLHKMTLITQQKSSLRIGATREFCARILCKNLPSLTEQLGTSVDLSIYSSDESIERLLLDGMIDYGFDCGRPQDPLIRYKLVKKESFGIFCAPSYLRQKRIRTLEELIPHASLEFQRIKTSKYLGLSENLTQVACRFNDLSSLREACVAGLGWAVLPTYTVHEELKDKKLVSLLPEVKIQAEMFGVWSLRDQNHLNPLIERAAQWLKQQSL